MKMLSLLMITVCVVVECSDNSAYKEFIVESKHAYEHTKIAACLVIVRNALSDGHNVKMKQMLMKTKYDKGKMYDIIVLRMIRKCCKVIKKEDVDVVLQSENVFEYAQRYDTMIDVDDMEVNGVEMKADEIELAEEIKKIEINVNKATNDVNLNVDDEVGFLWFKLEDVGTLPYYFAVCGICLVLVVIIGGMYLLQKEKEHSKKKKRKHK
jgi:hypothetical protein